MYSHCPTCTAPLGENRVLERFPVGRRVAFDSARGRLWALCPRCRSWSLAPLEEREEAIEEAERLFRTALVGRSTERIALGRVADGTELVRVGGAEEGELAGWRYGRTLIGRWRRHRRLGVASVGVAAGLVLLPAVGAATVLALYAAVAAGGAAIRSLEGRRPVFRRDGVAPPPEGLLPRGSEVEAGADGVAVFRQRDVQRLLLVPAHDEPGWRLLVDRWYRPPLELRPHEARRALRRMLSVWNAGGGSPSQVRRATERVVEIGSPDGVLSRAAHDLNSGNAWEYHLAWPFRDTARIQWADPTLRLALEIAANEEVERRALEGELALLEREWAAAEELAAISDGLLSWPSR